MVCFNNQRGPLTVDFILVPAHAERQWALLDAPGACPPGGWPVTPGVTCTSRHGAVPAKQLSASPVPGLPVVSDTYNPDGLLLPGPDST